MFRNKRMMLMSCSALTLLLPIALAGQSDGAPLTAKQARTLMRTAHEPRQYEQLAAYCRQQQAVYVARAKSCEDRLKDCERGGHSHSGKWPTVDDTAKSWASSYTLQAQQMGRLAARYEQQAHPGNSSSH